jgi:ribosomal protein S7
MGRNKDLLLGGRSLCFNKLVNVAMRSGNKATIFNKIFLSLVYMKETFVECKSSRVILDLTIKKLEPPFDLKRLKKSGRTVFIPVPCRPKRRMFLAIKFFLNGVRNRNKRTRGGLSWAFTCEVRDLVNKKYKDCYSFKCRNEFVKNILKYSKSVKFLKTF